MLIASVAPALVPSNRGDPQFPSKYGKPKALGGDPLLGGPPRDPRRGGALGPQVGDPLHGGAPRDPLHRGALAKELEQYPLESWGATYPPRTTGDHTIPLEEWGTRLQNSRRPTGMWTYSRRPTENPADLRS